MRRYRYTASPLDEEQATTACESVGDGTWEMGLFEDDRLIAVLTSPSFDRSLADRIVRILNDGT